MIDRILKEKENYGSLLVREKALIEHTSINPNASPHLGRIRNAIIGDILARLLRFHHYKTEVHYYVNDVSKQIALMLLGFKGNETFDEMLSLYVKMNKALEENPELEKEIFKILEKIEMEDKETMEKLSKLVRICVSGQREILSKLGINYDFFDYESKYVAKKLTKKILEKLEKTKRLKKDVEGRYYFDLNGLGFDEKMKSPIAVLTRSNGVGLYILRDVLYTIDKLKRAKFNVIVLGEDQKLYFKQLSAILNSLGYEAPKVVHYSFVLVKTKYGARKMSTRKGEIILVKDFLEEMIKKAREEMKKRNQKGENEKAEKIAVASLRYSIAKVEKNKQIIFDLKEALNFEGNAAPYLLYSYVRAKSILRKAKNEQIDNKEVKVQDDLSKEDLSKEETSILSKLSLFPKIAEKSLVQFEPSLIANYCYSLCKAFNDFYEKCPVLRADSKIRERRIKLIMAIVQVLENCFEILGLPFLEEM